MKCLIGLGANLGETRTALHRSLSGISDRGLRILAISEFLATTPIGGPAGQPEFLNAAALCETDRAPQAVWRTLQEVEQELGRVRDERWGARTIDIDILLYEQEVRCDDELTIPHPRMSFRRFVLEPAAEVAPKMLHPIIGWSIEKLLSHLNESPNLIAITGGDERLNRELACAASAELGLEPVLDPRPMTNHREDPWRLRRRRMDAVRSTASADPSSGRCAGCISGFWNDESLARLLISGEEFEAIVARAADDARPPRLLVLLEGAEQADARYEQALARLASRAGRGPLLRLSAKGKTTALVEIVAAFQAMQ